MKHTPDIEIGFRAAAEVDRLFRTRAAAARALGVDRKLPRYWEQGTAPSAFVLLKLHYAGADVMYILTGRRSK